MLAVDIGSVNTRAVLFDVVEGMYRFVARGQAPTTAAEPWNDVMEGILRTFQQISTATGRVLTDEAGELIIPEDGEFVGVNGFVATASAGQPIRAVLVGLMPDVSLKSGRRAADSTYLSLVDTFSLADKRSTDAKLDAMLNAEPDLVMVVGGTDGGAVESMRHHLAMLALAYSLMDNTARPPMLYAGNKDLADEVRDKGDEVGMQVIVADNVRPTLDMERLDSAQHELAALYHRQKSRNTGGLATIGGWTDDGVFPTAHGFARMVHLLGAIRDQNVLGIDLGSASTTVAARLNGERYLNVFGQLGIGNTASEAVGQIRPDNLTRWLTFELQHPDEVTDYAWNKSLFPHTIPANMRDLELEYAIAREVVRAAVLSARQSWHGVRQHGLLPPFQTVLLSGSTLTHTPNGAWSAMLALDALLPVGITRLLLDPYGVAAALGMTATINSQAVAQVLDTGAFIDLGTAISISGRARQGEIVLRGSLRPDGAMKAVPFEVRYGTIVRVPLAYGATAELTLHPRGVEIEGLGRRRKMMITGGELGLVVDARGRPWRIPRAVGQRREQLHRWQESFAQETPR